MARDKLGAAVSLTAACPGKLGAALLVLFIVGVPGEIPTSLAVGCWSLAGVASKLRRLRVLIGFNELIMDWVSGTSSALAFPWLR
jgi:hypothetical protein